MKAAAILLLIFAVILGIWASVDALDIFTHLGDVTASRMQDLSSQSTVLYDLKWNTYDRELDSRERFDAILGIISVFALAGSIVLFSQSPKIERHVVAGPSIERGGSHESRLQVQWMPGWGNGWYVVRYDATGKQIWVSEGLPTKKDAEDRKLEISQGETLREQP